MFEETQNAGTIPGQKVFLPDLLTGFTCDKCGQCCSVWEIPVDRNAYNRALEALGDEARRYLKIADPDSHFGYARLIPTDGRCGFQDGTLCRIHRDFGEELLFSECRKFPRILFRSPLAVHCTASFACRKIAESLDRAAAVRVLHLTADDVPFAPDVCDTFLEGPPCLCRGKAMTWDALFTLEHGFLEMLYTTHRSPEHCLLTMIELVRNLARDDAPVDAGAVDRELLAARVDNFRELSSRFLLAVSDADAHINFILSMLGARLDAGLVRGWELVPLEAAFSRWSGLSDDERRDRFLQDCRRCYVAAGRQVIRILENYLVCRVSGNPDFALKDVQKGLHGVAALLSLIRAAAVALAVAAGSPITSQIMIDSIRAVDTAFFHLPDFAELVEKRGVDPAVLLIVPPA